ncbi:hypothetical protein D047_2538B, partial [Vibrio parahaemolyticus VPTS-2010_2]
SHSLNRSVDWLLVFMIK